MNDVAASNQHDFVAAWARTCAAIIARVRMLRARYELLACGLNGGVIEIDCAERSRAYHVRISEDFNHADVVGWHEDDCEPRHGPLPRSESREVEEYALREVVPCLGGCPRDPRI